MGWKRIFGSERTYEHTVTEGFILTKGSLSLSFKGHPFEPLSLKFRSFQLLKVHEGHPIEVADCNGRILIHPQGDDRLIGMILRDPNQKLYDAASIFLAPYDIKFPNYDIKFPNEHPGKVLKTLDGFECLDGNRNPASLVYIPSRELNIDGMDVYTFSMLTPPQIMSHLHEWLFESGRTQAYDSQAFCWRDIGRYDFKDLTDVARETTKVLEERFGTRLI